MIEIGKYNTLRVVKELDFGVYLDGGELGEILLPTRYVPDGLKPDEELEIFLYRDSEDRLIATTEIPYAIVGEFALLRVVSVNAVGAFMDWGLPKELLVPFREQKMDMEEGRSYVVRIYLDEKTDRIAASAKLSRFLTNDISEFSEGQTVDVLITKATDLGYKCIVENRAWGILYSNEVFTTLKVGHIVPAYIKKIREDGKLDIVLQKPGQGNLEELEIKVLALLEENEGYLPISDKTDPEIIYQTFAVSKKLYKKVLGILYKKHLITINKEGITLR